MVIDAAKTMPALTRLVPAKKNDRPHPRRRCSQQGSFLFGYRPVWFSPEKWVSRYQKRSDTNIFASARVKACLALVWAMVSIPWDALTRTTKAFLWLGKSLVCLGKCFFQLKQWLLRLWKRSLEPTKSRLARGQVFCIWGNGFFVYGRGNFIDLGLGVIPEMVGEVTRRA